MDTQQHHAPLQEIHKVEYITHNHVDLGELIYLQKLTLRAVKRDTAAEEAMAKRIEELEKLLDDPEANKEKIKEIAANIKASRESLATAVAENTPPVTT